MDAPIPIIPESKTPGEITPESLILSPTKEYELFIDNKKYIIEIGESQNSEKLRFKLKELSSLSNIYYQNFYSLQDLQKINKVFRYFDNIKEAISSIGEIFEAKNASLKFKNNLFLLILKINKIGKGEEFVSLQLKENSLTQKEINENLSKEVNDLNKRIKELESENKNSINELKNEIQLLKKEIKELKKENEEIKLKINENKNIIKEKDERKIIEKNEMIVEYLNEKKAISLPESFWNFEDLCIEAFNIHLKNEKLSFIFYDEFGDEIALDEYEYKSQNSLKANYWKLSLKKKKILKV